MRISCTGPAGVAEQFIKESDSVLIGRRLPPGPDQIGLDDGEVSGRHARLTRKGGEIWVEDLGSTNGTWVNNKKIKAKTKTLLTAESVVRIGQTTLKVEPGITPTPAAEKKPDTQIKETPVEVVDAGRPWPTFSSGGSVEADSGSSFQRSAVSSNPSARSKTSRSLPRFSSTIFTDLFRTWRREQP